MHIPEEDIEIGRLVVMLVKAWKDHSREESKTISLVKTEIKTAKLCMERALHMLGETDGFARRND